MKIHLDNENQQENINRVSLKIGKAITEFCSNNKQFYADDLRKYVSDHIGYVAPASADRILRDLRQKGILNYRVINRRKSFYEILPVAT